MSASHIATQRHILDKRYMKKGAKMEWISVKDKLPNEGQKVRMLHPGYGDNGIDDGGIFKNGHFDDYIGELNEGVVSHWKPLSDPPPSTYNN